MIRRPPRSTQSRSSAASDVYKRQPTESEEAFEGTRSLMEDIGFSRAHVFRYSPRPLTAAFFLGDPIDSATKGRRAEELRRIARESAVRFHRGLVLSLIHISEPTRLGMISYAVFCLK